MNESFLRMAKAATSGSSTVTANVTRSSTRRSSSKRTSGEESQTVRMQLTEMDGILQWQETTGAMPDLGQFRSSGGSSARSADSIELEFERLAPSKITHFLAQRDKSLTPKRGLRKLDGDTGQFRKAEWPDSGRALLFVHGTFSNSENMLAGLLATPEGKAFLENAMKRYKKQLFVFDHPTLSVGPILNAFDMHRVIGDSRAKLDIVSHSRGGLVTRWWCDTFDTAAERCEKVILVGSPLAGTGLAAPPNIRETIHLLSQFSRALQLGTQAASLAVPVFSVVEMLLRVMSSVTAFASRTPVADAAMAMVPGLFAMSRVGNNPELLRLLNRNVSVPQRYHAIQSNFQPTDNVWKFWRMFRRDRVMNAAADTLFDGDNDLVVDTESMTQISDNRTVAKKRTLNFGDSQTVHHLNYFYQQETAEFLSNALL